MSDVKPLTEQEEKEWRERAEQRVQLAGSPLPLGSVWWWDDVARLIATLDALRAELATVKAERDRYKAEAMAARKAFDAARKAAIELCDMNGMAGRAGDAYRAIRAENEKEEGA